MTQIEEKLKHLLDESNINYDIIEHDNVVTIDDVERVLGISRDVMVKSLVLRSPNGVVIVGISGSSRLDKRKLAAALGVSKSSLDMLPKEVVEKEVGVPIGAIPPFGLGYKVVLDQKLLSVQKVYCGFGSLTKSLKIGSKDLKNISKALVKDVAE